MRLLSRTGADAPKKGGREVAPAGRWDACQDVRTRSVNGRWSGSSTSRASLQSRKRSAGRNFRRTQGMCQRDGGCRVPSVTLGERNGEVSGPSGILSKNDCVGPWVWAHERLGGSAGLAERDREPTWDREVDPGAIDGRPPGTRSRSLLQRYRARGSCRTANATWAPEAQHGPTRRRRQI